MEEVKLDTEEEVLWRLLNSKEVKELNRAKDLAWKEAQKDYNKATYEAWKAYEDAWRPLREAWEDFQKPYFGILKKDLAETNKTYGLAIEEYLIKKWPPDVPREDQRGKKKEKE